MDLLTAPEAAALLRVHPDTIKRWIRQGKLKASRLNGHYRLARQDVLALLQPVERAKHADTSAQRARREEWDNAVFRKYKVIK